jgi:ADP-sugar diphosphatase
MPTFTIPGPTPHSRQIPVAAPDGTELDEEALVGFKAFTDWLKALTENLLLQIQSNHTFHSDPWILHEVKVHHVAKFGPLKIGFMTVEAIMRRSSDPEKPTSLDRVVFLRGGSVAVLMILRPKSDPHERYVILTEQPRLGACGMSFLEIPAGMMDESNNVTGKAIQEIEEETGFQIQPGELINMTKLALEQAECREIVQPAMYPSPANLDESISLLLWEKKLDRKEIEALKGRLTGLRARDELITLRICGYDVLWREGARDAKTLAAWALYEGLNRSGQIEEKLRDIRMGNFEVSGPS